jgi:hypothetical protein
MNRYIVYRVLLVIPTLVGAAALMFVLMRLIPGDIPRGPSWLRRRERRSAGMTVNDVSGEAIANLGWKEIKLTALVFYGDTLYAESEVLEKRESKLRPTQGIVTVHTHALNQDGVQVMEFVRSALIP